MDRKALVLDGNLAAGGVKDSLVPRIAAVEALGQRPGLGTILVGDDPGSRSYVGGKHRDCAEVGVESIRIDLPSDASQTSVLDAVKQLNEDPRCTGFIVQLPLPSHIDTHIVLNAIDPEKDADGLHPVNLGRLVLNQPGTLPCTPRGILELLRGNDVPITGSQFCVIGCGTTVGRPLGLMLTRPSEHATVTMVNEATVDVAAHTRVADVVIAAAGVAHLVQPYWIKPGATVLSVGITRTVEGILGDVHPDVEGVAGRWTRATGGVGPMTRAMLLKNVVELAERRVGIATPLVAMASSVSRSA
ncbi:methylenetetrahydrofolate dehydrogenase (NADP+) / methenyltetrahydrofolate cyclohydrolase [Nocardioides alpinus]|jgi:methylenetetrahydrofolate dehydrogenase (NADP+) / methenyltetrahydrofolate cyclohydrolase|uniref:Bifunctional protein FolD n=2 Tax=Nocardioides TaxID=1839 RepID=A0A4Q2SMJ8_9ACTN|nr:MULTISPECIES: tetrahydrofolate dehydrogenase/cyclohydrolase catalytic domain-containing protein [Nocardioides]PKH38491.1 bifunctional methylenetetrahydrofolate dehydrogenase/methenyltetrahydrofolate cyclohydrolase [Nocardioides alpinus]RYC05384.1 bifunctional methylenetetrahydrofolate dehydrogenase/methenyltetrahydrofolate cyclohydrolase [Nocardioides zhouii]SFB47774.1 methylenetetrahydrofolate dehydrogenase (NADP+) / methenyltetrahydrofolate cyclohydrolase [Nocardioides alpinus]